MKIKKNDKVFIEVGKDNGKTGQVKAVLKDNGRIIVEGINIVKKHIKPKGKEKVGGITEMEASINASNVMIVCPNCSKKTRVSYKISGKTKERICKKCNQSIDKEIASK